MWREMEAGLWMEDVMARSAVSLDSRRRDASVFLPAAWHQPRKITLFSGEFMHQLRQIYGLFDNDTSPAPAGAHRRFPHDASSLPLPGVERTGGGQAAGASPVGRSSPRRGPALPRAAWGHPCRRSSRLVRADSAPSRPAVVPPNRRSGVRRLPLPRAPVGVGGGASFAGGSGPSQV